MAGDGDHRGPDDSAADAPPSRASVLVGFLMPPLGKCLGRIAPTAAMVDEFKYNTQNTFILKASCL